MSGEERLLERRLASIREEGRLAFIPFLVVGDPTPEAFERAAGALVEAGADVLELGFPFSDPPADGPVVQAADNRALAAGVTVEECFSRVAAVTARHQIPVSLLVYYNLVLQMGIDTFYARARAAGIDAVLVADVPLELSGPLVASAREHRVAPVFLASAVTSEDRARQISEHAEGYIYAAARVGITGAREKMAQPALASLVERLRSAEIELPILAGFGLSTPAHLAAVADSGADGAIVGSALVRAYAEQLPDIDAAVAALVDAARPLAQAARATRVRK